MISFSALQRAENSSISAHPLVNIEPDYVSVLFSEPKIPQCHHAAQYQPSRYVSVLFSEPKIPQSSRPRSRRCGEVGFSALQRAENSSIDVCDRQLDERRRFSALQRAENSSIQHETRVEHLEELVSVLFSEPKIPQSRGTADVPVRPCVSVLFSEPKIPQLTAAAPICRSAPSFSALQRAENSSIRLRRAPASRAACFSALQRAENSSIEVTDVRDAGAITFQCSSASRKFLN